MIPYCILQEHSQIQIQDLIFGDGMEIHWNHSVGHLNLPHQSNKSKFKVIFFGWMNFLTINFVFETGTVSLCPSIYYSFWWIGHCCPILPTFDQFIFQLNSIQNSYCDRKFGDLEFYFCFIFKR